MKSFFFLLILIPIGLSAQAQFMPRQVLDSTSNGITSINFKDLNNDGIKDIIISQKFSQNNPISYYKNLDNGSFEQKMPIVQSSNINWTSHMSVGDLNNDGWNDIVFSSWQDGIIGITINTNGIFLSHIILDTIVQPLKTKIEDIDNDGDSDIILLAENQSLIVYYNDGGLSFSKIVAPYITPIIGIGTEYYDFDIVDIDNDGFKDAVVGGSAVYILKNESGIFNVDTSRTLASMSLDLGLQFLIHLNDFDNDGFKDLVLNANTSTQLKLFKNNGNGYFSFLSTIDLTAIQLQGLNLQSIDSKDINGDGNTDIVVSHPLSSGNKLIYYMNNGNGQFSSQTIFQANMNNQDLCQNILLEDINLDGYFDIIWSEKLSYLLNNATMGIFEEMNSSNSNFSIFPNPFSTQAILNSNRTLNNATLTIYNLLGQEIKKIERISGCQIFLNRDSLINGVYFATLIEKNMETMSLKFILQD